MKQNLRASLGAVVLAIATVAAFTFALLNLDQRRLFDSPDDGVAWSDTDHGIEAWKVAPNSPGARAGIRSGDLLVAFNDVAMTRAVQVTQRLWRAGIWTQVRYKLSRNGEEFETPVVTAPAPKPVSTENYLRVVGLLYLLIGIFIFVKRWNAPRAVHFYVFCLLSFVLYSFHYSGKLDVFDWEVYWANIVAHLLAPALLLHFALVFPERSESAARSFLKLLVVYGMPVVLLAIHVSAANNMLGFVPWLGTRVQLEKWDLAFLGACFVAAGAVFYKSFREAPSGVLRQQLKWLTGGTLVGSLPFTLFYILPFVLDARSQPWMQFSALSLVLIPLCFAYAIIRYRLMDVDIIFKRGLAYTAATAGVVAVYAAMVALIGALFHTAWPSGLAGEVIAIVVA